jgi:hypothetical protein
VKCVLPLRQRLQARAALGEEPLCVPVRRESHRQAKALLRPAVGREPVECRDVALGLACDLRHHLGHDPQARARREPLDSREPLVGVDDGAHASILGCRCGSDNSGHSNPTAVAASTRPCP